MRVANLVVALAALSMAIFAQGWLVNGAGLILVYLGLGRSMIPAG